MNVICRQLLDDRFSTFWVVNKCPLRLVYFVIIIRSLCRHNFVISLIHVLANFSSYTASVLIPKSIISLYLQVRIFDIQLRSDVRSDVRLDIHSDTHAYPPLSNHLPSSIYFPPSCRLHSLSLPSVLTQLALLRASVACPRYE